MIMIKKMIFNYRGVTLLEMVVAVSLFAAIILAATGILKLVIEGQRNAIAAQNVQESMRYALEVIAKEVRTARKVESSSECINQLNNRVYRERDGKTSLYFKNIHEQCVKYFAAVSRFQIKRWPKGSGEPADGDSNFSLPITPNDIEISNLQFEVDDYDSNNRQGRVTIKMTIKAIGQELHKSEINLQTTIAARYYE